MMLSQFVEAIATVQLPNVFNPYADRCSVFDRPDAPAIRRSNLLAFLEAVCRNGTDTVWMGRDLGYRGGRRTGLALTDESHLPNLSAIYGAPVQRATVGAPVTERTASEIWSIIATLPTPPFLWNVFPLHPHEPGNPFSNRKFTARELATVNELNRQLIAGLGLRRIVAIGQDAATYSAALGVQVSCVRHPSYGGTQDFRAGIRTLHPNLTMDRSLSLQLQLA